MQLCATICLDWLSPHIIDHMTSGFLLNNVAQQLFNQAMECLYIQPHMFESEPDVEVEQEACTFTFHQKLHQTAAVCITRGRGHVKLF